MKNHSPSHVFQVGADDGLCGTPSTEAPAPSETDTLRYDAEAHLRNVRQLTFGGDNAEAYWSFDSEKLVFQANNPAWGTGCDQIFWMDLEPMQRKKQRASIKFPMVKGGRHALTSFRAIPRWCLPQRTWRTPCVQVPPRGPNGEYVWPIYEGYDMFTYDLEGIPLPS